MAYLGSWKIDDYLTFTANTHAAATGAATDADAVPDYRIYEDETGAAIATGSMAKLDDANTIGFYSERVQLTALIGYEKGKAYSIYISAAVAGVTGTMSHTFQMEAEVDSNTNSGTVTPADGSITAAVIATGAIDADAIADNAIDAGAIAADAINAAAIADGAIDAATFAAGAINAAAIADGAIDAATFAAGAINAAAVADGAIDAATFAAGAITAAAIATDAIDADALAADAIAELANWEVKGVFGYDATTKDLIAKVWIERNGILQNATACTVDIYDHDGTEILDNAAWDTLPTETAQNTWYAVCLDASLLLVAGETYYALVALTVGGVGYTRHLAFSAAA